MFKKGFTVREIKEIFRFIDILLELEDAEKEQLIYEYARKSQKGEYEMVITPLERIAMEKGMEKGKIEAAKKLLKEGMKREDIARILEIDEESF